MKPAFKKAALSIAVASTLALAGCSSSSGSDPSSQTTGGGATNVSGAAIKGVMKNAIVTAYELNDSGDRFSDPVGIERTNADGTYALKLSDSYDGGLLEIEVTADSGTSMICDATACGTVQKEQELELPDGFKLNALATKTDGNNKISAPVTAWSTMAVNRAKALIAGGETAAKANRQATAEVTQLAGFDISRTSAKAVTNLSSASADEQQAAVMNAAVAELVFSGGSDITGSLGRFAEALNDGVVNAEDSFTPASLSSLVKTVVEANPDLDESAEDSLNNQTASLDAAGDSLTPSYDPELDVGDDASQADKIAAFQKFVTQFRSWAGSIDETAASLQDETSAVSVALDADVATVKDVFVQAGVSADLVSKVLDAFSEQLSGQGGRADLLDALENGTTLEAPATWTSEEDSSVTGTMEATLVFENTGSGLQATVAGSVSQIDGESRDFDLVIGTSLTKADLDLSYDAEQVLSLLAQNTVSVTGAIGDGTGFERAILDLTATLELPEAITGGVTDQAVLDKFSAIGLTGNVALADPEAASFVGTISAKAVSMNGSSFGTLDAPFSPASFSLLGDFTATTGRTFNLSASLNNKNAQRFNLATYLDYNDTTASFDFEVDRAQVAQFVEYDETAQDFWFSIDTNNFCYDSDTAMDEFGERVAFSDWYNEGLASRDFNCNILDQEENAALDQIILSKLAAAVGETAANDSDIEGVWIRGGSYSDVAEINTEIDFPSLETADNFVNLSFNLAAGVSLVDMPKATAVVTLTRSSFTGGSVLANVSWKGGSYSLKVGTDSLNAENPEITLAFWNPQGFRLEAVGSEDAKGTQSLTGNVFVDGEDIGDVALRNGIPVITYPNGSETVFESLF